MDEQSRGIRHSVFAAVAAILLASQGAGVVAQATVNRPGQPDKAKPRYGHCADVGLGGCETGHLAKTGKGYAVCETYQIGRAHV